MKYFAYGSNMSASRLMARVPNVERIGLYSLTHHDLRFHKVGSKDRSGKCDAYFTDCVDDVVNGALFEIDAEGKSVLDRVEGLGNGYEEKEVILHGQSGDRVKAVTYCATHIDHALKPFSWYLNHVLVGASESGLPAAYIDKIQSIESILDSDAYRDALERAIHD